MSLPEGDRLYGPNEIGFYNLEDAQRLRTLRASLSYYKPSAEEIQKAITSSIPMLEQKFLAFSVQSPELAREVGANYRNFAVQIYKPMTDAELAARMVFDQIALPMHRWALSLYQQYGHPGYFVLYYDLAEGVLEAIGGIIQSYGDRIGESDQIANASVLMTEKSHEVELPPTTFAEVYIRNKAEFISARRLITEDPTGFALVDSSVEDLMAEIAGEKPSDVQHKRLLGYQVSEFVLGGAQLGQKAYKAAYALLTT